MNSLILNHTNVKSPLQPKLRDYQQDARRHIRAAIDRGARSLYFSLPTGTGKSVILGSLAADFRPAGRVLVVAHLRELVGQLADHMTVWCGPNVGVVMGNRDNYHASVVVGSIQTLARGRLGCVLDADSRPIIAVLVDEFHHVTAASYRAIIDAVRAHSPDVVIIGCSATPFRADKAGRDLQQLFPVCAFERSIADMQAAGVLAPLTYRRVVVPMALASLVFGVQGGERDYQSNALAVEAIRPEVVAALIGGTVPYLESRPTLAFCAGVAHAHQLAAAYRHAGVAAEAIDGGMGSDRRQDILNRWRCGEIQVVTNASVLGEGFDFPEIAALVLARPTASPVRYIQQLGRGTRLAPDKVDCLILEATAGEPDRRQVTLADVQAIPDDASDLPYGGPRNPKLVMLDPRHDASWRWAALPGTGHFIAQASHDESIWLVRDPDPHGSGLYRVALVSRTTVDMLPGVPGVPGVPPTPLHIARDFASDYLTHNAHIRLAGLFRRTCGAGVA